MASKDPFMSEINTDVLFFVDFYKQKMIIRENENCPGPKHITMTP